MIASSFSISGRAEFARVRRAAIALSLSGPPGAYKASVSRRRPLTIATCSPSSIYYVITLLFKHFRVMNVIAPQSGAQRRKIMKTFTIDAENNNITVHSSKKAAKETGVPVFASEAEFAELIGTDNKRLVAIWNSIPGVTPVTKFANRKAATQRIWTAIQSLGESAAAPAQQAEAPVTTTSESSPAPEVTTAPEVAVEASVEANPAAEAAQIDTTLPPEVSEPAALQVEPEMPVSPAEPVATPDAQGADVAPAAAETGKNATRAKKAPKTKKVAEPAKTEAGPREGSKTAQVVAMLKREGGATLTEIMSTMGWQKHTVRGFMAGAMKKAGFTVESFKPEGAGVCNV
jgi:sulfite reductase alpha subunit-like flavoprotein